MANDSGSDLGFKDGLNPYRADTDRNGVYTLSNGSVMEGRVDWFRRSSGIIYQDSSDTYSVSASNGYIRIDVGMLENLNGGTLSVGGVTLSDVGSYKTFYLPPSTFNFTISVSDHFRSSINYDFLYRIQVTNLLPPSVNFQTSTTSTAEGNTVHLVVNANNIPSGEALNYFISGINADRLENGLLMGTATIDSNGQARISLDIKANNRTDGPSTATVTIGNNLASASIQINDTSLTPTPTPTYTIVERIIYIDEGQSNGMRIQTTGVGAGTVLNYSITGITADRLTNGSLSGTAIVDSNGQALISLDIKANNRTDGPTTAVVTIGNNLTSASIQINDTSTNPSTSQVVMSRNNPYFITTKDLSVIGSSGVDKVVLSGSSAKFSVNISDSRTTIQDNSGALGTTSLTNVERLKFTDTNIALDIYAGQNAGMAYRMYKAALNRAPDLEGLGDWIYVLDNGANIYTDLARGFTESVEFKARYGPNISNNTFVTLLYNNVLGRAPDQDGLNAWVSAIEQRGASREVVLHGFSESPENISYSLGLIGQGMPYIEHLG